MGDRKAIYRSVGVTFSSSFSLSSFLEDLVFFFFARVRFPPSTSFHWFNIIFFSPVCSLALQMKTDASIRTVNSSRNFTLPTASPRVSFWPRIPLALGTYKFLFTPKSTVEWQADMLSSTQNGRGFKKSPEKHDSQELMLRAASLSVK